MLLPIRLGAGSWSLAGGVGSAALGPLDPRLRLSRRELVLRVLGTSLCTCCQQGRVGLPEHCVRSTKAPSSAGSTWLPGVPPTEPVLGASLLLLRPQDVPQSTGHPESPPPREAE